MTDEHRRLVERRISSALRAAISDHGPITRDLVGSAAKRVYGALRADDLLNQPGDDDG